MDEEYDIVLATEGDRERVAEFLRQTYYEYEPVNMALEAPPERPLDSIYALRFLKEETSLIAITKSGLIIGAALSGITKQDKETHTRQDAKYSHESYHKIARFTERIQKKVDIWKLTGADTALCVHALAVAPIACGRGVGKALLKHTREVAKAKGIEAFEFMCTSYYGAKIARSIGLQCAYKLPYSEYKNEKGLPVIVPPHPHKEVTVFLQKLTSED